MSSPYHKLFGSPPNYSKLHIFGCLCYPWLGPYSVHKLAPRSAPCVFLGYSLTQSAYVCFDPSTTKTYHSFHVFFVKSIFPLSGVNPSLPRSNKSTITTWFSITLVDSTMPSTPSDADHTPTFVHLVPRPSIPHNPNPLAELSHSTREPEPTTIISYPLPLSTIVSTPPITTKLSLTRVFEHPFHSTIV